MTGAAAPPGEGTEEISHCVRDDRGGRSRCQGPEGRDGRGL